jgi:hypothetical protein
MPPRTIALGHGRSDAVILAHGGGDGKAYNCRTATFIYCQIVGEGS